MNTMINKAMWFCIVELTVCLLLFFHIREADGQDAETVKKSVLQSITRIENYPAVVISGRFISDAVEEATTTINVRGSEIWEEYEIYGKLDQPVPLEQQKKLRAKQKRIMQCDLPSMAAFDSKFAYQFNPVGLVLTIEPSRIKVGGFSAMLPKSWITFGNNMTLRFRDLVDVNSGDVKIEPLADGKWKLSQTGLGEGVKIVAVRNRHIIVDPKLDFLVTEYEADGGVIGKLSGQLEWEKQDGSWYVKHGKHFLGSRVTAEWFITEISFDARKCRKQFDDMESIVPFATCVEVYDGDKKLTSQRYKGGKAGEEEYQLRKLAMLSRGNHSGE